VRSSNDPEIRPIASSRRPSQEFTMSITVSAEGCTINWYASAERSLADEIRNELAADDRTARAKSPAQPIRK
jgi:hypothetical protein